MKAPFPITPLLTAIAIAYRNIRLIADEVLPRVPVAQQEFKYRQYALSSSFTVPNTLVGRTSRPGQVEFGFTEVTAATRDHALEDPVPQADIENAPQGYDPITRAVEGITDLILLDREVRASALVFNPASYAPANQVQLAGVQQWDDPASDPIEDITRGLDTVIMRPNILVLGNAVATALRRNVAIVKSYNGSLGDAGIVPLEFIRELFELDAVLVGQGWVNAAKPGQPVTLSRVWGNHASLIYRDSLAGTTDRTTFGMTAQWGDRVAGSLPDPNIGMRGGQVVRVGESVRELVTASDLGYLIQDAI